MLTCVFLSSAMHLGDLSCCWAAFRYGCPPASVGGKEHPWSPSFFMAALACPQWVEVPLGSVRISLGYM